MISKAEEYCLRRIRLGLIRFRGEQVESFHNCRRRWYILTPRQHPESGRWRYNFLGGYPVYRNRLHWMIVHREAIPDTHFVDHVDEDRLNDHPDNLRLMLRSDSHLQGNRMQTDPLMDPLLRWFQFVGEHLREPLTEYELLWVNAGF